MSAAQTEKGTFWAHIWANKTIFFEDFIYRQLGHAKHGIVEDHSDPIIEQGLSKHGEVQGSVHSNLLEYRWNKF